ncbi:MCE family protein [Gordonia sp. LSe1-13]|uniref:MCE family protein n=1 Tax=Gordonia sesuvii TaxID=3116777 RepID=A0ABU7M935_9ACTN|nr:MCE family protein [Gordonia sp. LSe1-13]
MVRLGIFATVMIVVLFAVLRTIERPVEGDGTEYHAMFTDASGLYAGDDVREFGVAVGKVEAVTLQGAQARVTFTADRTRPIDEDATLAIRYQNLTGQRYLDVQPPEEPAAPVPAGFVVATDQTIPSFDITTLFNGLQPVLADLSPDELNKFAGSILSVVQGDGNGIGPALDAIGRLGEYAQDRQQVISTLVRNLRDISDRIGGKSANLVTLLTQLTALFVSLQEKLPGLIDFANQIPPVLDPLDDLMHQIGLTGDPNQPLDELIRRTFPEPERSVEVLRRLPGLLQSLAAVVPDSGQYTCRHGAAETSPQIQVLLQAERITVCKAG